MYFDEGLYPNRLVRARGVRVILFALLMPILSRKLVGGEIPTTPVRRERSDTAAIARETTADIQRATELLERNYAGYGDKLGSLGPEVLAAARRQALRRAASAASTQDEEAILFQYLQAFHDGHLFFMPPPAPSAAELGKKSAFKPALPIGDSPSGRAISSDTFLLRVPSFFSEHKTRLETIVRENRETIDARRNLIIDIRGNHGGADDTYQCLLPLIYTKPFRRVGIDGLATPDNADAWKRIIQLFPPDDAKLRAEISEGEKRLKDAREGCYISMEPDTLVQFSEAKTNPANVVILIDGADASSAEQFLLDARESSKVTLVGSRTSGTLDYGNIRPFPLPSGRLFLWIPTTRSRRLPEHPVDGNGIEPDVVVVNPQDGSTDDTVFGRALVLLEARRQVLQK